MDILAFPGSLPCPPFYISVLGTNVKAALCNLLSSISPPHFNCLGTFPVICVLITHNMPPSGSLEALLQASHVTS